LVCDHIDESGLNLMQKAGLSVDYRPKITPEELLGAIASYDAVVVRSRTKIRADVIQKATALKVIGRAGVGLDNVDVDAAKQRGIAVFNSPESLTNAVAELALCMMIAAARGVGMGHYNLKNGKWVKESLVGTELTGKTVGIVGFGRIGRRLAELLKPFNVKVLAHDVVQPDHLVLEALGVSMVELDDLLGSADFVSLHLPGGPAMRGFIDSQRLAKMKRTATLVNTSRGEVIDEDALVNALKSGTIRSAALDVFAVEPPVDKELLGLDNVVLTPHIGGQTVEAQASAAVIVAEKVIRHLSSLK
jgi:D-3-phosphoglycerate dehydrogenase